MRQQMTIRRLKPFFVIVFNGSFFETQIPGDFLGGDPASPYATLFITVLFLPL
jgi:hypothetical protein